MCGFITSSSTTYYIDSVNKTFCGGKFKNPVIFTSANIIIGNKGIITLEDGRIVRTSVVLRYF